MLAAWTMLYNTTAWTSAAGVEAVVESVGGPHLFPFHVFRGVPMRCKGVAFQGTTLSSPTSLVFGLMLAEQCECSRHVRDLQDKLVHTRNEHSRKRSTPNEPPPSTRNNISDRSQEEFLVAKVDNKSRPPRSTAITRVMRCPTSRSDAVLACSASATDGYKKRALDSGIGTLVKSHPVEGELTWSLHRCTMPTFWLLRMRKRFERASRAGTS